MSDVYRLGYWRVGYIPNIPLKPMARRMSVLAAQLLFGEEIDVPPTRTLFFCNHLVEDVTKSEATSSCPFIVIRL